MEVMPPIRSRGNRDTELRMAAQGGEGLRGKAGPLILP